MKKICYIALFVILIDQLSKFYVKTNFSYFESVEIFSWFKITFIENPGMAYGMQFGGETGKVFLTILRLALIIAMGIYFFNINKKMNTLYFQIPAGLIFAGAIGNLIDGLFYGIIFDKGLIFDQAKNEFTHYYYGTAAPNFNGYSGFFKGVVVDMLHFPLINTTLPKWIPLFGGQEFEFFKPIFNIADSAITIGAIWIILFRKKALPKELLN